MNLIENCILTLYIHSLTVILIVMIISKHTNDSHINNTNNNNQNNHNSKIACSDLLGCSNSNHLPRFRQEQVTVNKIIFTPLLSTAHVTTRLRPVALFSRPLAQESHSMLAVSPPSQNVQIRDS